MDKFVLNKKRIDFPVFEYYVLVIETNNFDRAAKKLGFEETPRETSIAFTRTANNGSHSAIFVSVEAPIGHIVHESWHAIHHMLTFRGAELEEENVAYHLEFLVSKITRFVRGII